MKYTIVLLSLLLIGTSIATSTSSTATFASLAKISTSKFGKTLIDTIQIELKAGTGADPRPRISQLLAEIRDETQQAIQALDDNIALVRQQCKETQDHLSNTIDELIKQVTADTAELDAARERLRTLNLQRQARSSLVQGYTGQLDDTRKSRERNQKLFEERDRRFRKILSVLDRTKDYIEERVENRNAGAFLQKSNVLLEVKQTVASNEFQAVSKGWGKFISFMATKALNKLKATLDEEAATGLNDILRVLNDVITSVNQDISSNNAANEADRETFEGEERRLENLISATQAEIAALSTDIANVEGRIKELEQAIETNKGLTKTRQEELLHNISDCEEREVEYATNLEQRNNELYPN